MLTSREKAIERMNGLGAEGTPFLFVIDFLQQKPIVLPLSEVREEEILFQLNDFAANVNNAVAEQREPVLVKHPISQAAYAEKFRKVVANIKQGNSFLVNLTCETPIESNLSLQEVFYLSEAKYKLWYKDNFVVFSPECFMKIENGLISSYPMKGTIDAAEENAREKILNSPKEKAEHYTIVDLIRNDLSMVASEVEVTKFRYIDEITTERGKLLQVSSQIEGKLPNDYTSRLGDILFALLPAGSVSGAPKNKTMQIIAEAEGYERGCYTGVFGVFDGKNLDSGVMIRFMEQTSRGMVYKSGGGITAFSCMEDEYNEMIHKIYVPLSRKY